MAVPDSKLKLQQKLEELEVAVQECFLSQKHQAIATPIIQPPADITKQLTTNDVREQKMSFGTRFFARFFGTQK